MRILDQRWHSTAMWTSSTASASSSNRLLEDFDMDVAHQKENGDLVAVPATITSLCEGYNLGTRKSGLLSDDTALPLVVELVVVDTFFCWSCASCGGW